MTAVEWIALAGLALTVLIASIGSWRQASRRDGAIDERLKALNERKAEIVALLKEQSQATIAASAAAREAVEKLRAEGLERERDIAKEIADVRRALATEIEAQGKKRHALADKMSTLYGELHAAVAELRGQVNGRGRLPK